MNRLKLWLFAIVVVAAAGVAVHLHTLTLRSDALAALDARLDAAAQLVAAANGGLAHDAAGTAALIARDAGLSQALAGAPEEPARGRRTRSTPVPSADSAADPAAELAAAVERAGRAALGAAERALGFRLPDGTTVVAASRETLARREEALGDAAPLLRAAVDGASPRGYVLLGGKLLYAAAAPAGDGRGVLLLAPVGEAFVRGVAAAAGLPVLLVVPEAKPVVAGNLPPGDEPEIVKAARVAGVKSDAGRLGRVDLKVGVKLPEVPLLGGAAPAYRVQAVALEGVKGASVVAATATAPRLAPIAVLQWQVAGGLAIALVLAVLFGLLVRAAEPPPMLPEPLVSAAVRIEKGDFAARVPALAGQLGTVAAALNRAVEAASAVPAPVTPPPAEDIFARAARPAEADPSAFEFAARPAAPAFATLPAEEAVLPAPPAPEPAPPPRPAAIVPPPPADEPLTAPAELLQAAAQAAPADGDDEQAHWRQVFSDFLRSRAECGETATGLTFERFAQKLASNKATLVAKYACRTVRFQVYVKDGKAALKATPVR